MGKKARQRSRQADPGSAVTAPDAPVGPRQPCPCGSGRRYKACHGAAGGPPPAFVLHPFAGLAGECDLVALREYVPAATADVHLAGGSDRVVRLCTLLPGASPALVRDDGSVWLGLQVQHAFRDPSRDLAAALQLALDAEAGSPVVLVDDPGEGPTLQDLLADEPLEVEVHEGFDFWLAGVEGAEAYADAMEQANATVSPTTRLESVEAAYWADTGSKEFLRWAMPQDEGPLLDALARLHVSGDDVLVPGAKLVGMFRAHGLLVPVWDLPPGTGAAALEEPAAAYHELLESALASPEPLSTEERSARAGLAGRQLTLR